MATITGTVEQRFEAARRIQNREPNVVFTRDAAGVPTGVDDKASAKANLAAIKDHFTAATTKDKQARADDDRSFLFGDAVQAGAKAEDALDALALPFRVVRDLTFAGVRGARALIVG